MSEKDKQKWNEKYKQKLEKEEEKLPQPNERVTQFDKYFHGNDALDMACGLGANSIYLAQKGYRVTALDVSDVAIEYINKIAVDKGLSIQGKAEDLDDVSLPQEEYDLIINTFYLDRELFIPMKKALKPKGYLFIETFYQVEENDPNPHMKKEYTLKSQELLDTFKEMEILYYHENQETGLVTLFAQKLHPC